MITRYRNDNTRFKFTATAPVASGDLMQKLGKVGIYCGEKTLQAGEKGEIDFQAKVEIPKDAAATTFAEGGIVGYDATNKVAVAAGAGDFDIGVASKPSGTADLTVMVHLNF